MTLDGFPQDRDRVKSPVSYGVAAAPHLEADLGIDFNNRCAEDDEDGDILAHQTSHPNVVSQISSTRYTEESATILDGITPQNISDRRECKISPVEVEDSGGAKWVSAKSGVEAGFGGPVRL